MPFHSPAFLFLFVGLLALLRITPKRWQRHVLLAAGLAVQAVAGWIGLVLVIVTVAVNFYAATLVAKPNRQALLVILGANVGLLALVKYRALAEALWQALWGGPWQLHAIAVPLGISFYVFQLIAYQVEVYRGRLAPATTFDQLLLYAAFVPTQQAGPLVPPADFFAQTNAPKEAVGTMTGAACLWLLWGAAKKVAADQIGLGVDATFDQLVTVQSVGQGWWLAVRYAWQIYLDFSGYSDMALGLGLLLGYRLPRNFAEPYLAADPSAFWRRWHISLSSWLREYLYIPLGGNRQGQRRTAMNLMTTMVLGGLWHGAALTFVLWGFLHGLLLVVHRRLPKLFSVRPLGWLITFVVTVAAWVPFRAPSWAATKLVWSAMCGLRAGWGGPDTLWWATQLVGLMLVTQGLEHALLGDAQRREDAWQAWCRVPAVCRGAVIGLVVSGIAMWATESSAYIYARF